MTNGTNGHGRSWYTLLRGGGHGVAGIHAGRGGAFAALQNGDTDLNELVRDLAHNAMSSRAEWFRQFTDPRRDINSECGYPDQPLGADLYRQLYDREPIANRVVQVLPKESWQAPPLLFEDEDADKTTAFEKDWDALEVNLGGGPTWHQDAEGSTVWELAQRADILSGIGHFGVILFGFDDGRALQDPVEGSTVIVNYARPVPIFRDLPVRNAAGTPALDAGGGVQTNRVQTGWKQTVAGFGTLPPDSPPTANEAAFLNTMVKDEAVVQQCGRWDGKAGYREEAVSRPARFLNGWRSELNANDDRVINPMNQTSPTDNARPETRVGDAGGWRGLGSATGPGSAGYGHGGNGPTTRARDAQGRELPGTDDQYAWRQQPGDGRSPAGTDQQYYGVQFGASEAPADEPRKKGLKLLFLRAFDESLVQVVRYEWNVRSPRFGLPVMYRITLNDPREVHSGVGLPLATVFVHWSRVLHLADVYQNAGSSPIFAPPRQRPVLNRLLDLRKIYGASAEGYWKCCFAGISFETNPQLGGDVEIDLPGMKDSAEAYFNGLQRYLLNVGMTAKTLAPSVTDPTPWIAVQIEAICIQLAVPVRVFKGSERGELASSQDDASWNDRLRSRQNYYITPKIIVPLVDRLIAVGVLSTPKGYSVEWPDLDSLSDTEKAGVLLQRTQAYTAYASGGMAEIVPQLDYMTRFDDMTKREAEEIITAAQEARQEMQEEQQALADEHGFEPAPPEGFQNPEPEEPAQEPAPVTVRPGEQLVHPQTGATVAQGPPLPQPKPTGNALEEKDPKLRRLSRLLAALDASALDGSLMVWVNVEPGQGAAVVDRLDWYPGEWDGGEGADDPASQVVQLARRLWGVDHVTEQNEGGTPTPAEKGWVRVFPSRTPTGNVFCKTGHGGGVKPDCKAGEGGTKTTKRGETLHAAYHDGNRWVVTATGQPAPKHVQQLGIPHGTDFSLTDVHVNLAPKGVLTHSGVDAKGRVQSHYSASHEAKQAAGKFGRVRQLLKKRQQIFRELDRDAKKPALKDRADVLRLIMRTGMRPGSDTDTGAEHKSYGATTLEGRHVLEHDDGSVTLRLVTGKNKGREVDFPIPDATLATMLKDRAEAAGPDGRLFAVTAAQLRAYAKDKDGGGFKTKDHRTALGTETAAKVLAAQTDREPPATPKEYKKRALEVAGVVAGTLGNTPAVALKSYIDPRVWEPWKQSAGV